MGVVTIQIEIESLGTDSMAYRGHIYVYKEVYTSVALLIFVTTITMTIAVVDKRIELMRFSIF